jgi:hypothetical protein
MTLKEEHRLRVSEERVLKKISGPKTKEVERSSRKLETVSYVGAS